MADPWEKYAIKPSGPWDRYSETPPAKITLESSDTSGFGGGYVAPALSTIGETAKDVGIGAVKGVGSTIAGTSKLLRHLPGMKAVIPEQGVDAFHAMTRPEGLAQQVGYTGEQAGEFLLPGGLETKAGKLAEAIPKIGKYAGPATRIGARALTAGGQTAMQTGEPKAAETGALIGAGTGILGEAAQAVAPSVAESALGVSKKLRGYGKTPGVAALDEIRGISPSTIEENAINKSLALTNEIEDIARRHPGTVTLKPALNRLDSKISQAARQNDATTVKQLSGVRDSLITDINTGLPIPSDVPATRALDLKRGVRNQFVKNWNPEISGTTRDAAAGAGHDIDAALDAVLGPEFTKRNQVVSSLIPIAERAESVGRGAPLSQRVAGRLAAHTGAATMGALGAAEGYHRGGLKGGLVGGLAGLVVPEIVTSPQAQMFAARAMRSPTVSRGLTGLTEQVIRDTR